MYPCIMIDIGDHLILATSATRGVWLETGEYEMEDSTTWENTGGRMLMDAKQLQDLRRCLQHAYECGLGY